MTNSPSGSLARSALRYGAGAKVIKPKKLRDEIREIGKAIARNNK